jgi:dihydrofolate reductase
MKVKFIAVSALGLNRQIGLNGSLPWSVPEEYEHFKKTIRGQYVLIGRKNFELHHEDVEGAKELVLSKSVPGHFKDMNEVVRYAEEKNIENIYVIGGAESVDVTSHVISEFYCWVLVYKGAAVKYFPQYMSYDWEMLSQEIHENWTLYHMKKNPDF